MKTVLGQRTRHLTVVLEDIYQPHNASAVLRSCDCFGVQDVHIIENLNTYEINPDVVMGASKWLNLYKYNNESFNTPSCFEMLKEKGYKIIATSPHKHDCLPEELPLDQKTALVFGNEHKGLTHEARQMADGFVRIPMTGFTESLNISVSVAIFLYELTPRIRKNVKNWQLSEEEQTDILFEWITKSIKNADLLVSMISKQLRI